MENRSDCLIPIFLVTEKMKLWQTSVQRVPKNFLKKLTCRLNSWFQGVNKMTLLRFGLQDRLNQILSNSVKEGALFKKKKVLKN